MTWLLSQEGELRPQLLDRFGLSVSVSTMTSIAARTRMVMDRLEFEKVRGSKFWGSPAPAARRLSISAGPCRLCTARSSKSYGTALLS